MALDQRIQRLAPATWREMAGRPGLAGGSRAQRPPATAPPTRPAGRRAADCSARGAGRRHGAERRVGGLCASVLVAARPGRLRPRLLQLVTGAIRSRRDTGQVRGRHAQVGVPPTRRAASQLRRNGTFWHVPRPDAEPTTERPFFMDRIDSGADGGRRALRRGRSVAVLGSGAVVLLSSLPALGAPQSFRALSPDAQRYLPRPGVLGPRGYRGRTRDVLLHTGRIQNPLFRTEGFRGWSGNVSRPTRWRSARISDHQRLLAGPIPAGTWHVEIGAGFISPGSSVTWELTVDSELGSGARSSPQLDRVPFSPDQGGTGVT